MELNPFRPYRPATCSGKRVPPTALAVRRGAAPWKRWLRRLIVRKRKQRAAREKRGYALRLA